MSWTSAAGVAQGAGSAKGANPTLIEWLDSPVVYQQDDDGSGAEESDTALVSPVRARWHYYSMARKNFRGYLQGEQAGLKSTFTYCARCCRPLG
ncbi:MAG: DNA polymerase beta superfamily protein [Enterobacteriaceae bacterium]